MRLTRPRFTVLRLMVAAVIAAVMIWSWARGFAGLDYEESTACVFLGILLGLTAFGISALFVVALKVSPSEPPPPESRSIELPQFTIGCLMSVIAISAIALALICLG
jgi:hypothetical protein